MILSFLLYILVLSIRVVFRVLPKPSRDRVSVRYAEMIREAARKIIRGDTQRTAEYSFVLQNINLNSGTLLEIGCCDSLLSYKLARSGYDVYAIDIRPYFEKHPNLKFQRADARNTPFRNGFFDRIIAVSTIEHVGLGSYGDPLFDKGDFVVLAELSRILKKGGKMLITFPFGGKFLCSPWLRGSWQRVYDEKRLKQLIGKLYLEKEEYYVTNDGIRYSRTSKEVAKATKATKISTPAVVHLVLKKI